MATGITEFLNDLSLDPTSMSVLIIAWKFKAKEQCVFTRTEFIEGMKSCGWVNLYIYSTTSIIRHLDYPNTRPRVDLGFKGRKLS